MLKAGLMAREYGYTPTEMLGINDIPTGQRFHLDADIFAATNAHIEEQREQNQEQMDPSSNRVASPHERKQMARGKEERAKQREQMQQAGMNAPSPEGQMSRMDDILAEREQARQMREAGPDGVNDV